MRKFALTFLAISLVAAACSASNDSQVASLDATTETVAGDAVDDSANEEIILEFSQCMRDNGAEDFEDPLIGPDGEIEFKLGSQGEDTPEQREEMRAAFDACQDTLEGFAFGPGSIDRSEIEDTLYEFAVCMREQGIDVPDPDFSSLLSGEGGGGVVNIFGDAFDREDAATQAALEACRDVFGGSLRLGGGAGGGNG
jgi:hypothetical protein